MAAKTTDLNELMKTLARASKDPEAVTVGEFAKAVQALQTELHMLESEVQRLTGTVGSAFGAAVSSTSDEVEPARAGRKAEQAAPPDA